MRKKKPTNLPVTTNSGVIPLLGEWPVISDPVAHIESQSGQYLAMYEGVMDYCMQSGEIELGRAMLLDLLKMTKVGRTKADLAVTPIQEVDLSHLKNDDLLRLVGATGEGANESTTAS